MRIKIPLTAVIITLITYCDLIRALSASAINSQNSDTKPLESVMIEYYKDHEVTESQARDSLRLMVQEDFQQPAHCKPCSSEHLRYCRSKDLLKDHCCCNQSHKKDPLYFIPHECYINSDRCHPSLGSCLTVMYIRNCCCDAQLKKHWKSVLANGHMIKSTRCHWILAIVALVITSLYIR